MVAADVTLHGEACRFVRERPDAVEELLPRQGQVAADERLDPFLQIVDAWIRVCPGVAQRAGIELANHGAHVRQLEEPRAVGHEQADRELHRRHVIGEIQSIDRLQQLAVALQRRPRSEGDERRGKSESDRPGALDDALEVGARVSFLQEPEDVIVDRLDGGRDEGTMRIAQTRQRVGMFEQVLDLDRDVVRQLWKLGGEAFDDRGGVTDAVEEVRVAKRDVLRAGRSLGANVGHDDVDGDDAESPVVHRHDRTMAAAMLAAATGLGVAGGPAFAAPLERRVLAERR